MEARSLCSRKGFYFIFHFSYSVLIVRCRIIQAIRHFSHIDSSSFLTQASPSSRTRCLSERVEKAGGQQAEGLEVPRRKREAYPKLSKEAQAPSPPAAAAVRAGGARPIRARPADPEASICRAGHIRSHPRAGQPHARRPLAATAGPGRCTVRNGRRAGPARPSPGRGPRAARAPLPPSPPPSVPYPSPLPLSARGEIRPAIDCLPLSSA
jgi:hypothetical protein